MSPHFDPDRDTPAYLAELVHSVRNDAPDEAQWQAARQRLATAIHPRTKRNSLMDTIRRFHVMKIGWLATAATVLIVLACLLGPLRSGPNSAWGMAVHTLRNARTMTYRATVDTAALEAPSNNGFMSEVLKLMAPQMKEIEIAYKDPGLLRQTMPLGVVSIMDLTQKKAVTIIGPTKQFMELDLSTLPPEELATNVIDEMRNLPAKADEAVGRRDLDGRTVEDYRVTTNGVRLLITIDAQTGNPVRMEGDFTNLKGLRFVATDFRFNEPLDDALFSLEPPEGYTRMPVKFDLSAPSEQDLINTLRFWLEHAPDGTFPSSMNPLELALEMGKLQQHAIKAQVATMAAGAGAPKTEAEVMQESMKIARGFIFVMQMNPETDWHYAGKGVKPGNADQPIFWYKPAGSQKYRVICGDLSVEDVELAPTAGVQP